VSFIDRITAMSYYEYSNIFSLNRYTSVTVFALFLCWFYHHCDQMPDRNNLRKELFLLAYNFRGFQCRVAWPHELGRKWWQQECGGEASAPHSRQEAESKTETTGQTTPLPTLHPSHLPLPLPSHPSVPHLQLGHTSRSCHNLKNSATIWGPRVQHMSLWRTFHIQTKTH
jgi:hypothetical protein